MNYTFYKEMLSHVIVVNLPEVLFVNVYQTGIFSVSD